MTPAVRRYFLSLHAWAGLSAGLVLVLMALTGASMMFRPQLDPVINGKLLRVAPAAGRVTLDTIAERARAVHPAGVPDFVRYYGAPDSPALLRYTNKDTLFFDPHTGRLLGEQNRYRGFFGTLENLHRFRWLSWGSLLTGSAALVFVFIILSGLILWMPPAWTALRGALTLKPRLTGRSRLLNLHRTFGVYAALVVLLSALTGLPQAFAWYRQGIYHITGSPLPEAPAAPATSAAPVLPMETFARRAAELVPGATETLVHFPAGGLVEIYLIAADAPHPNARTLLWLDAATGAVRRFTPYAESSLGHKLYFWTISLHLGQVGGIFGQLLMFSGALCVPLLAVTGMLSYRRRQAGRHAPAGADKVAGPASVPPVLP